MKAMTYSEYGSPDVLELTDQPMPKVGPGMVLVKVNAASVNPVDWKIMGGYLDSFMDLQFPAIPGWDVAGVVEAASRNPWIGTSLPGSPWPDSLPFRSSTAWA